MSRLSYLAVLTVLCLALACTAQASITLPGPGSVYTISLPGTYDFDGQTFNGAIKVETNDVVIKNIKIVQSAPVAIAGGETSGIYIVGGCNNISVANSLFIGPGYSIAGVRAILTGIAAHDIVVKNCTFTNWASGVYLQGSSTTSTAYNVAIVDNLFFNNNVGISADWGEDITVARNTFCGQHFEGAAAYAANNIAVNYNNFVTSADVYNEYGAGANPINANNNWWAGEARITGNVTAAFVRTVAVPMRKTLSDSDLPGTAVSVSNDSFIGTGAWKATPGPKVEKAFVPEYLFGHSIKVSDIKNISFATKNTAGSSVNDWYITIYTKPYTGGKATWYGQRLTGEPMYSRYYNAPAGQWNVWSSDASATRNLLVIHDSNWSASGYSSAPTLDEIVRAGNWNWAGYPGGQPTSINYGIQDVLYIYFSTGNPGCLTFDGMIDAFKIELWSGESMTIDLESDSASDALWVDVDPATQYVKTGDPVFAYLNMSNTSKLVNGYQAFLGYDTAFFTQCSATLTDLLFRQPMWNSVGAGTIDLAAGCDFLHNEPATNKAATLANLALTAGVNDGTTGVFFRPNAEFVSTFSTDDEDGLDADLINSPSIVIDNVDPTIAAPANVVNIPNDAGEDFATGIKLGYAVVADDRSGVASVTNNAPAEFPVGTTTVTWTVTDKSGNQATNTQLVTVVDVELPTIAAPADITQNTDAGKNYATVDLGIPAVDDNCAGVTYANNAPATFPVGTTTVTWTATDASGNKATDTQTVTVEDKENPQIACPSDITVNTDLGQPSADLNLGVDGFWRTSGNAVVGVDGKLTITSTKEPFTDGSISFNPASAFTFVQLTELSADFQILQGHFGGGAPRFSVRVDMDGNGVVSSGDKNVFVYWGSMPNFNDYPAGQTNTGNLIQSADKRFDLTQVGGTFYGSYTEALALVGVKQVLRVSVVVDAGWQADQSIKIDNIKINANKFVGGRTPAVSDNCGIASVVGTRDDGLGLNDPYPIGATTITWTVTDIYGNAVSCNAQTITVIDNEKPVVTKGTLATTCFASADAAKTAALNATTATDNSGSVDVVVKAYGEGRATVVVTATDPSLNSTSVSYYVRIDGAAPVLTIPGNITVNADAGKTYATLASGVATATDNTAVAHFEGFEDEAWNQNPSTWQNYSSSIARVQSGTNGIDARSGSYYGLITPVTGSNTGAFTRLGGYWSKFEGGFKTSVDVYIDLNDPAVAAKTYGWDLSSAANGQNGNHRRDFIFHAAADDNSNPGYVLISGSNNSNNSTKRNDLENQPHYAITASGWYTFEWNFRDDNNVLAVDLILRNAAGEQLWTMTRSSATDLIDTIVGGNRYMWFTFVSTDKLAVDDTKLVANSPIVTNTGYNAAQYPIGTTSVVWTATDLCGNSTTQTQTVTVNNLNTVSVPLTLEGVSASLNRTIMFQLGGDGSGSNSLTKAVVVPFTAGVGTAAFDVPAAVQQTDGSYKAINWSCVTAKDEQHTLRARGSLTVSGKNYAGSAITLLGGDLTNDNIVDIRDFGVFAGQFNTSPALDTLWKTRNADINCSGKVDTTDFLYLQNPGRFLSKGENLCGGTTTQAVPKSSISVYELVLASGLTNVAIADVNNDKIVNQTDVQLFVQKYMAPKRGR